MRSSRRARPSVCIGRNNLQEKVASTETCGLFLNTDQEPRAFRAHNRSDTQTHMRVYTHTRSHAHKFPIQTQEQRKHLRSEPDRQRERERERETLFNSHSSPPTHLRALFTQVCKCSFHFFSSACGKKKREKKLEMRGGVEPGGAGSWDRDGETDRDRKRQRESKISGSL